MYANKEIQNTFLFSELGRQFQGHFVSVGYSLMCYRMYSTYGCCTCVNLCPIKFMSETPLNIHAFCRCFRMSDCMKTDNSRGFRGGGVVSPV